MTQDIEREALLPCPAGHGGVDDVRIIGGPGTAGGPKYWCGCMYCNWRTWGNTSQEAAAAWNRRALTPDHARQMSEEVEGTAVRLTAAKAPGVECVACEGIGCDLCGWIGRILPADAALRTPPQAETGR